MKRQRTEFAWRGLAGFTTGAARPVASIAVALAIAGLLIWISGKNPFRAYGALFDGAFGSRLNFSETLIKTVPLVLCSLGIAIAFRCAFFNIGAEGQFYMGALMAAWLGVSMKASTPVMMVSCLGAAFFAGGALAALSAWMKIRFGASEVITTIMLNYVAMRLVGYAVNGPLKEAAGFSPQTDEIAATAKLAVIWPGTRLHAGFLLALLGAIVLYAVLFKTVFGYQVRAVGLSPKAAAYGGMNAARRLLEVGVISGGFAGIAGAVELMGVTHRLWEVFSPGYGFDAIAVSLLARNNPLGIIASSLLFGALRAGGGQMQRLAGVSSVMIYMVQALIIVFVMISTVGIQFRPGSSRSQAGEVS